MNNKPLNSYWAKWSGSGPHSQTGSHPLREKQSLRAPGKSCASFFSRTPRYPGPRESATSFQELISKVFTFPSLSRGNVTKERVLY